MSRAASGDIVYVPAKNNIYTVLTIIAVLVEIAGLVAIFMKAQEVFDKGLF